MEELELSNLMQQYSISHFRANPAYVKCCEAIAVGLGTIQDTVQYLSKCLDIDQAEGIWLDYLGTLVGTTRGAFNMLQFFCVNAPHLNEEKYFYFEGESDFAKGSLSDVLFRQKIKAKIAYNASKGTREENLRIIKGITNADVVVITNPSPMTLDVTLYGDEIIYPNIGTLRDNISTVLGMGIGLGEFVIKSRQEGIEAGLI